MKTLVIETVTFSYLVTVSCTLLLDSSSLTTPRLVEQHGYPLEEHKVETSDGYILTIHRIPYSPKLNNTDTQRRVALLMHGLLCASNAFLLLGPQHALAYILSDAGYDVWLGNARGNVYSKDHVSKSPLSDDFWNFDWHEIGIYDLPAMIDYALNVTGEQQIRYFGHSQGATTFAVLMTMIPSFKDRIIAAHLLAPVVFIEHAESPIFKALALLLGYPNPLVEVIGSKEFAPSTRALELLADVACKDTDLTQDICTSIIFLTTGGFSPHINRTIIPEIIAIMPSGVSSNQVQHYAQLHNSGKFCQFDYGMIRNTYEYGSFEPPDYDLNNYDVPTYLYYADNDYLASVPDVERLIGALSGTGTLKGTYRVPYADWNHIDFIFGMDVENVVYNVIMSDIADSS